MNQEKIKSEQDLQQWQQRLTKQIKVLEIERNMAGRRGFWKGLIAGMLALVLLIGALGLIAWQYPSATLGWVAENFLMSYTESLFAGFPDAYMTNNRERVLQVLDEFTNAMQYQQVSQDDFRNIARQIFGMLQDRRITYQEMDAMLESMRLAAQPAE